MFRIFVINPGSTSTKVALYEDECEVFVENLSHSTNDLAQFSNISSQYPFRFQVISAILQKREIARESIAAFVGRGGLLRPIPSGTYLVDAVMLKDLHAAPLGEHASNLGGILADAFAAAVGKPAFIVDPVVVDELKPLARFSGHPELPRISIFHALNHKAVARKAAAKLGKAYVAVNLIVAHLGGGISVASHKHGKVVDVNNALDGEGPFSPERTGTLPVGALVRLCFSGKYSKEEIQIMVKGQGGMVAYLGMNDMREVTKLIQSGDKHAQMVYQAMAYQVAKEIAAHGAVLEGKVDAVVLSGGIAYDQKFVSWIEERCSFLAPIMVFPGEEEMQALALGALRVLCGEEKAKDYATEREKL